MSDNEKVIQLLADSRMAFLNQQNETALELAEKAIRIQPGNPEAYKCAANAYMSLERYDEAVRNYRLAVKNDPDKGDRYFDLGYACAACNELAEAMKYFAKAEELGCIPENLAQLYTVLGIACFDIGRYNDALVNLGKAEQLVGIDVDILQRKAIIYGIKNDISNGLLTANQLKLVAPTEYIGYQIAFKLLIQSKRLGDARKELDRAEKYATMSMDFYFDCITLELEKYQADNNKEHFDSALAIIEKALNTLEPTPVAVMESYINAAEIYLQLEKPDQTIDCLNAAQNPAYAYNNGFRVVAEETEAVELTEYDVEDMIEADRARIAEEYGDYGLEELVESIDADEDGNRDYFTEIEDEAPEEAVAYRLDEAEEVDFTSDNYDQINRLYVGAYTLKRDFDKVVMYARKLQSSESVSDSYIGMYTEANAMKELGLPDAPKKYEEVMKFFRNATIKDPTDIAAVTFRIQCHIDMGNYGEAEKMCSLLTKEARESLLGKISKAKSGGD